MGNSSSVWRSVDPRLLASVIAAQVPNGFLLAAAPLVLGMLVDDRGFSEDAASLITSGEMLTGALATIVVAAWVGRRPRAGIALAALGAVAVTQGLSILVFAPYAFVALRGLVGIGAGIAGAAGTAAAAGARDPERLFAMSAFVGGVAGALIVLPLGVAIDRFGAAGAYGSFAFISLAVWPLVRWLPPPPAQSDRSAHPTTTPGAERHTGVALLVLASQFVVFVGENAVWSFSERIGHGLGLSPAEMGPVLAITGVIGLGGAGAAVWLGLSRGRALPLLGSIAATIGIVIVIATARSVAVFTAAQAAWAFLFNFSTPYLLGALAALDRSGRWAAAGIGVGSVGGAIGPAVGGLIVVPGDYTGLAALMAVCGVASMLLLGLAFRRWPRRVETLSLPL